MTERLVHFVIDNGPPVVAYAIAAWLFRLVTEFTWFSVAILFGIFFCIQFGTHWSRNVDRWNSEHGP